MEAVFILIMFFIFGMGCAIARKLYIRFSPYALRLILIYLLGILIGIVVLFFDYWHLYRLNSLMVPFITNEVKFNFLPKYSGEYTIDIRFLNPEKNNKYESCDLITSIVNNTTRASEKNCKNEIIYRSINTNIGFQHLIRQLKYNEPSADISWGYYNHNTKEPALHIDQFNGIQNKILTVDIKIDATQNEIQQAKPVIIIGPLDDIWREHVFFTHSGKVTLFIVFVLPFVFSIIMMLSRLIFKLANTHKI